LNLFGIVRQPARLTAAPIGNERSRLYIIGMID
jgi:hypothetical protein